MGCRYHPRRPAEHGDLCEACVQRTVTAMQQRTLSISGRPPEKLIEKLEHLFFKQVSANVWQTSGREGTTDLDCTVTVTFKNGAVDIASKLYLKTMETERPDENDCLCFSRTGIPFSEVADAACLLKHYAVIIYGQLRSAGKNIEDVRQIYDHSGIKGADKLKPIIHFLRNCSAGDIRDFAEQWRPSEGVTQDGD